MGNEVTTPENPSTDQTTHNEKPGGPSSIITPPSPYTPHRVILVLGAPGSGKGTQCKRLAEETGMVHISTGDLCREEVGKGTLVGRKIATYVEGRELVPDFLIFGILIERIKLAPPQGVLLDGFPRTPAQAQALLIDPHCKIERVLVLEIDDEKSVARITKRNRNEADRNEESVRRRLEFYHANEDKVLKFFKNITQRISTEKSEEDVQEVISQLLASPVQPNVPDDGGWGAALEDAQREVPTTLTISVDPVEFIPLKGGAVDMAITIKPPDLVERVPVDVCCVIDISGSMSSEATFQDPDNEAARIGSGFSQLDLVKHAVKTIINTLTDQDRVSIVSFESDVYVDLPLTLADEAGVKKAILAVQGLYTQGSTNMWGGLRTGLDTLRLTDHRTPDGKIRKSSVFLLTDGVPDSSAISEQDHLQEYLKQYPQFVCQVHTFGFGYSLLSNMLYQVSERGHGTFGFIPDAKIVGTCFVNTISNACSTMTQNCCLSVNVKNGAKFTDGRASPKVYQLGALQYGQARDIVVPVFIPESVGGEEYIDVTVEYTDLCDKKSVLRASSSSHLPTPDSRIAYIRNEVVTTISKVITQYSSNESESLAAFAKLSEQVKAYVIGSEDEDPRLSALFTDVSGRVTKSISTRERYNRWGQHYLRAILRAHQLQLRTNFMDPGLQVYGGQLFQKLQERGGEIFVSMPMVANPENDYSSNHSNTTSATAAPVDNSCYYAGGGGGCFDASCWVIVKKDQGEVKIKVCDVKKGDFIQVVDEEKQERRGWARVDCLVQIERRNNNNQKLIEFSESGLKITEKHPIRLSPKEEWKFPRDCKNTNRCSPTSPFVFNFVLEPTTREEKINRIALVNDVECVTFGHGLSSDPVVWHPFYSTNRVLDVLSGLSGFEDGFVCVSGSLKQFERRC